MNNQEYKKFRTQLYYKNKYKKKVLVDSYIIKRRNDIMDQIIDNLSSRACVCFKKARTKRNLTHMQLIGCDKNTLKEHIKTKFTDKMNFDNYGKWEIDHIKPISLFDLTIFEDMIECFNYKNLQPLWKKENRQKSNKY